MDQSKLYADSRAPRNSIPDTDGLFIQIDHREALSAVPGLLTQYKVQVGFDTLKVGDYLINEKIILERKTGDDFVQSLISNRLFNQMARLSKSTLKHFLLLEGNPFRTNHQIEPNAIKGAFLSIMAAWQTPIIYSRNPSDSALLMIMLGKQLGCGNNLVRQNSFKPKRLKTHQLRFVQGLPQVGPLLAKRLLDYFGTIEAIVNANEKELRKVEGIGKKSASKIRRFLRGGVNEAMNNEQWTISNKKSAMNFEL